MGFIEELRRKIQGELSKPRVIKKPEIVPRETWELEKTRRAERLAMAHQAYADSGLQDLLVEMGKLGAYKSLHEVSIYERKYEPPNQSKIWTWQGFGEMPPETYLQEMTIGTKKRYSVEVIQSIEIEVAAEGTIFFRGGFLSFSPIVDRSGWERDKGVLERALGRVYNHPKTEIVEPSSDHEPRGFGW